MMFRWEWPIKVLPLGPVPSGLRHVCLEFWSNHSQFAAHALERVSHIQMFGGITYFVTSHARVHIR